MAEGCTWTISKKRFFNRLVKTNGVLKSPIFTVVSEPEYKWRFFLRQYPDSPDDLSLTLVFGAVKENAKKYRLTMTTIKEDGKDSEKSAIFITTPTERIYSYVICPQFLKSSHVLDVSKGLLVNDELTIRCKFSFYGSPDYSSCQVYKHSKKKRRWLVNSSVMPSSSSLPTIPAIEND